MVFLEKVYGFLNLFSTFCLKIPKNSILQKNFELKAPKNRFP